MYRTEKTKELVLKGIPESTRGELWLLFSGERGPPIIQHSVQTYVCDWTTASLLRAPTRPQHLMLHVFMQTEVIHRIGSKETTTPSVLTSWPESGTPNYKHECTVSIYFRPQ